MTRKNHEATSIRTSKSGAIIAACCLSLLFSGFQIYAQTPAEPDYAKLAGEAWKRDDTKTAIELREKAYQAKPNGENLFWLLYSLQLCDRTGDILALLSRVPKAHWYPCGHDTEIHRIFAAALMRNQERERALSLIYEALDKNDARQNFNFEFLVARRNGLAGVFLLDKEFRVRYAQILDYVRSQGNALAKSGLVRMLFEFSMHLMRSQLQAGTFEEARRSIVLAKTLVPLLSDPVTEGYNAEFFGRALEFRIAQAGKPLPGAVTMKYLALFITGIDSDIAPKAGPVYHRENIMGEAEAAEWIRLNREEAAMAGLAYEYMSRGRLGMVFDFIKVDAMIVGADDWKNAVVPHLGAIQAEAIDRYDGFLYYYDHTINEGSYVGGNMYPVLLPAVWYARTSRLFAALNVRAEYQLMIHELFHGLETLYGIKGHGYTLERQAEWPEFYRTVYDRLGITNGPAYYEGTFLEKMAPQGLERLAVRQKNPENLSMRVYRQMWAAYEGTDYGLARQARELYRNGNRLAGEKRYNEALIAYQKALALIPCYPEAHCALGWFLLRQFPDAPEVESVLTAYLSAYEGVYPDSDIRFSEALLSRYSTEGKAQACLDFIAGRIYAAENPRFKANLDYHHDRALEKLGRQGEIQLPVPDARGRLITASGEFDGLSQYLEIGARSYISGTQAFSIVATFRSLPTKTKQLIISQRSPHGFNGEYMLYLNPDGTLEFFVYGSSRVAIQIRSPFSLQDGAIHRVAATRAADGSGRLHVDGRLVAQAAAPLVPLLPLQVYVGADRRDMASYFKGSIVGVQVFARELDAGELLEF